MGKLEGKLAVITGGSTGIGLATTQRFVVEGAYLFITGRRQARWIRRSSGSGTMILNGSGSSIQGTPGLGVSSASKAAVRSFARTWTSDLKGRRIRVNTLSPGPIDTPIFETSTLPKVVIARFRSQTLERPPMQRMGTPEEIANAALFLASDDSRSITGIELFVDGGNAQVRRFLGADPCQSRPGAPRRGSRSARWSGREGGCQDGSLWGRGMRRRTCEAAR